MALRTEDRRHPCALARGVAIPSPFSVVAIASSVFPASRSAIIRSASDRSADARPLRATLLPQLAKLLALTLADPVMLETRRDREHPEHKATAGRRRVETNVENDQPPALAVGLIGERENFPGIPAEPVYLRDHKARRPTAP